MAQNLDKKRIWAVTRVVGLHYGQAEREKQVRRQLE